jgi:hypothetical protein
LCAGGVSLGLTWLRRPDDDTTVTMGVDVGGIGRGFRGESVSAIVDSRGEELRDGCSGRALVALAPADWAGSILASTAAATAGARNQLHARKSLDRQYFPW